MPPAQSVDDALRRATQAVDALKRAKPSNAAEERVRAAELMRQQQELIDTARRVTADTATKRFTNGHANGSAAANSDHWDKWRAFILATVRNDETLREFIIESGVSVCTATKEAREKALEPLRAEIAELKDRLAVLEARPAMKYCGVWDWEKVYSVGDFVTDEGSLWHCQGTCKDVRPGSSDGTWKLAVKRGRDGKGIR